MSVTGHPDAGAVPNVRRCREAASESDGDRFEDADDSCPDFRNPARSDVDGVGLGDVRDF